MDVEAKQFDDDFYEFRGQINELERRLASVITQVTLRTLCHLCLRNLLALLVRRSMTARQCWVDSSCWTVSRDCWRGSILFCFFSPLFLSLFCREIIQTDLEKKNTDLLNAFALDLKQVQEIFLMRKETPPVNDNMPPRAGAVAWVRGLVERVEDPMNRLKGSEP